MLNIVLGILLVLVIILVIKYFTGKGKVAERRSGLERIACSIGTIFRRNVDDAASSIRTARVMKDEAKQEVNDALNALDRNYNSNQVALRVALKTLTETTLPKLNDMPGRLEASARKAKEEYKKSVESGNPIEAYKQNAYKFLQHKKDALNNIEVALKMKTKLQVTIDTAKAQYQGDKMDLEMIKNNLDCMVDIPQLELMESINKIKSLQNELNTKMNEDNIRVEVEREISSERETVVPSDFDKEFEDL